MGEVGVLLGASFLAVAASEMGLRGRRVQAAVLELSSIFGSLGIATACYAELVHGHGAVLLAIYWVGGFLVWFAVRSHVESSILLRMIYLLRDRPSTPGELLKLYESGYGLGERLNELERAGLIDTGPDGMRATRKGAWVVRAATWLR
jgi:hypothetical protein